MIPFTVQFPQTPRPDCRASMSATWGKSVIYWRSGLNSQEGLILESRRAYPSLRQLAALCRAPAKVWGSVSDVAEGQLHSQTGVSALLLGVQRRGNGTGCLLIAVCGCLYRGLLETSLFCERGVCLCTCPCRSECQCQAWLSQTAESSDCGWYRWRGCYSADGQMIEMLKPE